ncbi:MAG: hypothetical protein PHN60_00725 [Candidatus Gracilibacteria bacterium]|nr:hypothetical protein [Candidatus Gracilibacteria bacterium]
MTDWMDNYKTKKTPEKNDTQPPEHIEWKVGGSVAEAEEIVKRNRERLMAFDKKYK